MIILSLTFPLKFVKNFELNFNNAKKSIDSLRLEFKNVEYLCLLLMIKRRFFDHLFKF